VTDSRAVCGGRFTDSSNPVGNGVTDTAERVRHVGRGRVRPYYGSAWKFLPGSVRHLVLVDDTSESLPPDSVEGTSERYYLDGGDRWNVIRMLRTLTRIHHYRLPILGLCGLVMTVTLSSPGANVGTIGPLRLDAFYVSAAVFGALTLSVSTLDTYDPEDYGLEPTDSET
jgi:hypothetical protein